jgi:peptidoglycan/xylan/chitin deacetylase (PgdA/CDA1 family)
MPSDGADTIAILTYHSLDATGSISSTAPRLFEDQMACLGEMGFRGISLREAVQHRGAHGLWPAQRVVLTFDDGYANFYEAGYPVISRHGFTATIFLVTHHVGGLNDWGPAPAGLGQQRMLSWEQMTEMSAQGIEVGAHTQTHPNLREVSAADAAREIGASRQDIENHLHQSVESFAYPFGHLSAEAEDLVRAEYRIACTTQLRRAQKESLLRLPRIDTYYLRSPNAVRRLLEGRLDRYLTVRRWARTIRGTDRIPPTRIEP